MLNTVSGRRATMETAKSRRAPGVERMASMAGEPRPLLVY
jgi:hypothetical protein